jgi:hypothetical protein
MHATQPAPEDLTADLLGIIQRKFYEGDAVAFNKDKRRLLKWAVLWPATYMEERGVTLPPGRYKEIFLEIIMLALQQGNTGQIKYRPAWLGKVVQSHFKIHWEEIYDEAKSARSLADHALAMIGKIPVATKAADPVREMALAAQLLKGTGRPSKRVLKSTLQEQPNLL